MKVHASPSFQSQQGVRLIEVNCTLRHVLIGHVIPKSQAIRWEKIPATRVSIDTDSRRWPCAINITRDTWRWTVASQNLFPQLERCFQHA